VQSLLVCVVSVSLSLFKNKKVHVRSEKYATIMASASKRKQLGEAEFQPPKLPKTLAEKDTAKRLIVILENASLETVKVGAGFHLLNSTDHAHILKRHNRDTVNIRPDITHQVRPLASSGALASRNCCGSRPLGVRASSVS
jgi:hypothetical protein